MSMIGVDLGKDGGLVCLGESGIVAMSVMPVITSSKSKKVLDLAKIKAFILTYNPTVVVVEKLTPLPAFITRKGGEKQFAGGNLANFSRGYSLGSFEGLLVALGRKYVLVAPQSWQADLLRDTAAADTKQAALIVVKRLWPDQTFLASERSRKPHGGLVDAACIAEFGRRKRF